jgi:hypothetical protein
MADRALIDKNTNQKDLIDTRGTKPPGDDLCDGVCADQPACKKTVAVVADCSLE